jgi:hypothetical protein
VEVLATLNINQKWHLRPVFPHLQGYYTVQRLLDEERTNASLRLQTPQHLTRDVLDPVSIEFIKLHNALIQALSENGVTGPMWNLARRLHRRGDWAMYPPSCEPAKYKSVAMEYARIKGLDSSTTDDCIALAAKVAILMQGEHRFKAAC